MKIYVLNIEDFYDGVSHFDVELFDSEEKAINRLKDLKIRFFNEYDIEDYNIDVDTDFELDVYLKGFYDEDRYCLYITTQDLM